MKRLRKTAFRYYLAWKYAVRINKPLLLLRLMKNIVAVYVLRRPLLRYVDFAVDFPCNLNCDHCFATAFVRPGREAKKLSVDDYRRIAAQCRKLGAISFSFQGGEPFLFLDRLVKIIAACRPRSSLISVTTNGTLCTRENVARLRRAGVDIFTISIDSLIPEEHDAFRGVPGSLEKTLRAVDLALEAGIRVTIGTTVSHQNVRSPGLRQVMDFAREKKCLLVFAMAAAAGKWKDREDLLLTEEDLTLIAGFCRENPYVHTDLEGNYLRYGCGAMKEIIYVTPYGDVLACPFLHVSFGRLPERSLAEIRRRALRLPYLRVYRKRCLAAADPVFRRELLAQMRDQSSLPVDISKLRWPEKESRENSQE